MKYLFGLRGNTIPNLYLNSKIKKLKTYFFYLFSQRCNYKDPFAEIFAVKYFACLIFIMEVAINTKMSIQNFNQNLKIEEPGNSFV